MEINMGDVSEGGSERDPYVVDPTERVGGDGIVCSSINGE